MKLLPASPIEFRESCSRPPDTVYATEIIGAFGTAVIAGTEAGIMQSAVEMPLPLFAGRFEEEWGVRVVYDECPFGAVMDEYHAYLNGEPVVIHAMVQPLTLTPFVIAIHETISRIPRGETVTYGDIAILTGYPGAARAAGTACRRNRVLLAIPCHRVVAANGIGGYGGNIPLKCRLLAHEGIAANTKWH